MAPLSSDMGVTAAESSAYGRCSWASRYVDRTSGLRSALLLLLFEPPPTRRGPLRHVNWWLPREARRTANGEPGKLRLAYDFIGTIPVTNILDIGERGYLPNASVDPDAGVAHVGATEQRIDVVRLHARLLLGVGAAATVGRRALAADEHLVALVGELGRRPVHHHARLALFFPRRSRGFGNLTRTGRRSTAHQSSIPYSSTRARGTGREITELNPGDPFIRSALD